MPDPVMVVCVDGPSRGKLRAVTGGERKMFLAYDNPMPSTSIHNSSPNWDDVTIPVLTYHVHTIHLLGFLIRVASLHINTRDINPYDVLELLFSESARQATYRAGE